MRVRLDLPGTLCCGCWLCLHTSAHIKSVLNLYSVGNLGFLLPNKKPLCLKLTISPGCGFHLLAKLTVPALATKVTPFGLETDSTSVWETLTTEQRKKKRTGHIPTAMAAQDLES